MKYLAALILALHFLLSPYVALATNTHATDLERGSSQSWTIADASQTGLEPTTDFTGCTWIAVEDAPGAGEYYMLFAKGGISVATTNSTLQYALFYRNDGNIVIEGMVRGGSANYSAQYEVTLTPGTPYHVCLRYIPSTSVTVWVNAVQQAINSTSIPATLNTNARPFGVGVDTASTNANFFDGRIDDVQFYNNSTVSISDLYNTPCAVSDAASGLQGRWKFDNDGVDASSNPNDLTNNNSATFTTSTLYSCGGAAYSEIIID